MLIKKDGYLKNTIFPNSNETGDQTYFIIDETTEEGKQMSQIYKENCPFVDFVHDGEFVTKVIVLDKPEMQPEVEDKQIELQQNEQGEWEYVYVDIPLTKEQELDLKATQLEQENLNIMLATTEMYEEQYQENLNLMVAITELYEMNMEV